MKDKNINVMIKPLDLGDTLDPSRVQFTNEYYYIDNLTDRLLELDEKGNYKNKLAKEFVISDDGLKVSITLRNRTFSDGSPITSTDVANTIKRLILKGSPHTNPKEFIQGAKNLKSFDDNIEGIKIINEKKLRINLNHRIKEIHYYFHLADYGILHPSQVKKEELKVEDWNKVTSGAYKLDLSKNVKFVSTPQDYFNLQRPSTVTPIRPSADETEINLIQNKKVDFGIINFNTYKSNLKIINNIEDFSFFGDSYNTLTFIGLNIENTIFSDVKLRRGILKKILKDFDLRQDESKYASKAYQYFLPEAKGHLDIDFIKNKIKDFPDVKVPDFKIETVPGMANFLLDDFIKRIQKVLGNKIELSLEIKGENYSDFLAEKKYQATTIATSMSYKVLAESLNLSYTSRGNIFKDPSGSIKEYLKKYQATFSPQEEIKYMQRILEQMLLDAECIPVFYSSSPKFANNKKIDVKKLNLNESMKFEYINML